MAETTAAPTGDPSAQPVVPAATASAATVAPTAMPKAMPPGMLFNHKNVGLPELIRFENVTKVFGTGNDRVVALQDVNFVVHDLPNTGELVAIVGPSGCGKSTLLRMLAGLHPHYPPTTGTITAFGQVVTAPSAERGMVDQKYSLLPHLSVVDNIAFGLMLRGESRSARRALAREWTKKVGLDGAEDKYPHELSGGMQQRVSIAATLILKPKVLLMDEPFGALDPRIRMQMQWLLVKLWEEQQSTIFIVTHSIEEAVYLGDRVLRMSNKPGRIVESLQVPRPTEQPEQMRKQPWYNEVIGELLHRLESDAPASGELPHVNRWGGPSC